MPSMQRTVAQQPSVQVSVLAGAINRATKESLSRVRSAPLLTNEQDAATYTLPDFNGDLDALDVLVRCASLAFRRSRSEKAPPSSL